MTLTFFTKLSLYSFFSALQEENILLLPIVARLDVCVAGYFHARERPDWCRWCRGLFRCYLLLCRKLSTLSQLYLHLGIPSAAGAGTMKLNGLIWILALFLVVRTSFATLLRILIASNLGITFFRYCSRISSLALFAFFWAFLAVDAAGVIISFYFCLVGL